MLVDFGTLYKKSKSTGKIQQWSIRVNGALNAATITTVHGGVGEKLTTDTEHITEGKNIGRSNETTPYDQAVSEAQSKYDKKLKSGYVKNQAAAQQGKVDKIIKGGVDPQLAHAFNKQGHKIKYPCAAQPKLDGIRCIATKKGNDVTLWTRTRKPILSCPHIIADIQKYFKDVDIVLDGELYNHSMKRDFERIVSAVRQESPVEDSKLVEFHIYDVVDTKGFDKRFLPIAEKLLGKNAGSLKVVNTFLLTNDLTFSTNFEKFIAEGYEGMMVRNLAGGYEHKRSYNLQKVKEFEDEEFDILDVIAGKMNTVIFVCETAQGDKFEATMSGDREYNQRYLTNRRLWEGKRLTVQFQGLTGARNVPRFPIGKCIRDYE
ncbi:MAG: hypothetical protein PHY47_00025 [Lachnospiraceae bacterium]|nr:hypothetical protein [Lachnospiraceae bacterium]